MTGWYEDADGYHMNFAGNQSWGPGHMIGWFDTDTPLDPTIWVRNAVDNDTTFGWTDYDVKVTMDRDFTLSNAAVYTPGDWTATITSQHVLVGSEYVGTISYHSGTPVAIGETLDFGYKMAFSGGTHYTYCQETTPIGPIPEPGTLALLAVGLAGLVLVRRRLAR